MKKYKYWWNLYDECPNEEKYYSTITFPDNTSEKEIEEVIKSEVMDNIEWGYFKEDKKED